jgi:hypothetical protein
MLLSVFEKEMQFGGYVNAWKNMEETQVQWQQE